MAIICCMRRLTCVFEEGTHDDDDFVMDWLLQEASLWVTALEIASRFMVSVLQDTVFFMVNESRGYSV